MVEGSVQEQDEQTIDVGEELVSWETWDNPPYERGAWWYIIVSVIGIGLIAWAIWQVNYLFAIIVLITGTILFATSLRKSRRIPVYITTLGVVVGHEFYDYRDMKDFAIVYQPPHVKLLYLDFKQLLKPLLTVNLEDVNPNAVRESLLPFVFENLEREEEHLTDTIKRVYKL